MRFFGLFLFFSCVSSNDAINLKQTRGTLTGNVTARENCAAQCHFREGFVAGDPSKAVITLRFTCLAQGGRLSRGHAAQGQPRPAGPRLGTVPRMSPRGSTHRARPR